MLKWRACCLLPDRRANVCQANLLHHCADAARVPTVLPERPSRHVENLFAVPRFVFLRISPVKTNLILLTQVRMLLKQRGWPGNEPGDLR
jgi:hypothetical protein